MEGSQEFLQSRPLIAFQMDGSHLNNVLQSILSQHQQLTQGQRQVMQRLGELEEGVREVQSHQRDMERYVSELSGSDKLSQVRVRLEDLEAAMDRVVKGLDDTRKMANAAGEDADQAGRLADQAHRALVPLQEAIGQANRDVEGLSRQCGQDRRDVARVVEEFGQSRAEQERRLSEAVLEAQQRAERVAREGGGGGERVLQMIAELSDRTDENFRSVEESARAVDAEISRQNADVSRLRAEMVALDEKSRSRVTSLSTDVDNKYEVLLNAFREYEKSSNELEEHLAMAGQALARRRR